MVDWQLIAAGVCVAGAALFLVRTIWSWRDAGRTSACGGCNACPSSRNSALRESERSPAFIPLEVLQIVPQRFDRCEQSEVVKLRSPLECATRGNEHSNE